MALAKPATIDEYIASFPTEVQERLQQIRRTIQAAAPKATEAISYAIPTFKLGGNLVHFAGFKAHIGMYPAPAGNARFQEELARYKTGKGSVRFSLDEPLPLAFITRLVKFRMQDLEAQNQNRRNSMDVQQAYDHWAEQYDTNQNKTRDLEAIALQALVSNLNIRRCLEIGCGTGKNTRWLVERCNHVTAVDFSAEMLAKAKQKVTATNVEFQQADITQPWTFDRQSYDLITFSLMLEHIEHLGPILEQASKALQSGGFVYVGELHPFKQYSGSKARFETEHGVQVVTCFNHHVSDFVSAARNNGFAVEELQEFFDDDDRATLPRVLALLFRKL